jgi:hypothetical protein
VGFIGSLLVMGGFAYLLGLSWGAALLTASAHWTVMLFLVLVLFFYAPANNQVFQSGETCCAFFILLFMVLRKSKRMRPTYGGQSSLAQYR